MLIELLRVWWDVITAPIRGWKPSLGRPQLNAKRWRSKRGGGEMDWDGWGDQ